MPWKPADAKDHIQGLTAQQARVWARVANDALTRCTADGGKDCEGSAIRQANTAAQRVKESAAVADTLGLLLPLNEVGRVLSADSEGKVKAAIEALQGLLAKLAKGEDVDATQQTEALREARELLEAELSHGDQENLLRAAVKAEHPGDRVWVWLQAVYDDYCVYSVEQADAPVLGSFKRSYSIVDGKVTLGDAVKVQAVTTYVPVAESGEPLAESALEGDIVPLVEKAVRKDGTVGVKVISAGWGTSGYYSADVLKRDGPKAFPKGTHMYLDHPTAQEEAERPERSVKDLAAVLQSDARWMDDGADGPGLYAEAKVRTDHAALLNELAGDIGVSIRALGRAKQGEAEGRQGPIVESIAAGKSVDFVTLPGRGGRVLELFESARARASTPSTKETDMDLAEAQRQITEAQTALETERTERQRLAERLLLSEARTFVADRLAGADIPDVTRARLTAELVRRAPAKEGALDEAAFGTLIDEAVQTERGYIAALTGSGQVRGMGSGAPLSEADRQQSEQAATSLEESFRDLMGDDKLAKLAAAGR